MNYFKLFFLLFIVTVLFFGCGYREGTIQPDQQSYLVFTGNVEGSIATIDGGNPIELKTQERTLYQIKPGRHDIIVKNGSEIRVNRSVLINSGATKEIHIP